MRVVDEAVSRSNICMTFSPADGSSFKFFSLRAIAVLPALPLFGYN